MCVLLLIKFSGKQVAKASSQSSDLLAFCEGLQDPTLCRIDCVAARSFSIKILPHPQPHGCQGSGVGDLPQAGLHCQPYGFANSVITVEHKMNNH